MGVEAQLRVPIIRRFEEEMEKEHLLQELANLKCILGNYESTSKNPDVIVSIKPTTRRNLTNDGTFKKNSIYPTKKSKSMIFLNPNKINSINSANSSILADKVGQTSFSSTKSCENESKKENGIKVYINPNFKKSDVQSYCATKNGHTNVNKHQKTCPVSNFKLDKNYAQTCGTNRVVGGTQNEEKTNIFKEPTNGPLSTNKYKIFINPKFTARNKMTKDSLRETSRQTLNKKINTDVNEHVNQINKPEECMKINDFYSNTTSIDEKIKSRFNMASTSKTIFLNPKFESRQKLSNNKICDLVQDTKTIVDNNTLQDLKISVKRTNESSKFPNLQCKPTISSFDSNISKTDSSKLPNQCVKLHSSPFVALSKTKLIRKRKSSLNLSEKGVNNPLNKPAFLSKTKLIRTCISKSNISNSKLTKERIKHIVSKTQPQAQLAEKKLNKSNSINSNLVQVAPTSTSIMKIQSKNGKSLRLIRRSMMRYNLPPVEWSKVKSLSILQKHKRFLTLQAKRKRAWTNQNKLKSQYPKISLPNNRESGANTTSNKYVYRNKTLCSKKSNPSHDVLNKKNRKLTKLDNLHAVSLMFSKNTPSKYRLLRKQPCSPNKLIRSSKHTVSSKTNLVRPNYKVKWKGQNHNKRKSLSIVNIGGVFYKCSRTCLAKNKTPKKVSQKQSKGPLLHIRGQRFQLDHSGQTLTCLDKTPGRQRIDIGGVTFIGSSSGSSLIRTNYHTARSILVQAKQKSISLLTRKLKKNNEPCPFFHRFGRCTGKERGTCIRLHESKFVAVCKKFVAGQCADNGCLLSHQIGCYNMPTCQHYLAGHCGRDACPYPHVKLSDSAPICLQFLQGFCVLGDECPKRHLELCPSFEKGLCSRGKFCPYPHPKSKSSNQLKGKLKYLKREPQLKRNTEVVSNSNLRYFEDVHLQKENEIQLNEAHIKLEECSSEDEDPTHLMKNRPRLGRLPSFIPLNSDDSINSALHPVHK